MTKLDILGIGAIFVLGMGVSSTLRSEVTIGGGGAACFPLISEIRHNWSVVKRYMLPNRGKLRRAKDKDFYCISAQYTRNAMERTVSRSVDLRCYRDASGDGMDMCCDRQLRACAKLRPGVVEISQRRVAKKKADPNAQPSSSSWMKVPTDEDQWKTPTEG